MGYDTGDRLDLNRNIEPEDLINPLKWGRVLGKVFIIIIMLAAFSSAIYYGSYLMDRSTVIMHDNVWFRKKLETIRELDRDILSAKDAMNRQVKEDDKRFIRFLGGGETAKLNNLILGLEAARAEHIKEYNVGRERTDPKLLPELPSYIMFSELDGKTVVCDSNWGLTRQQQLDATNKEIDAVNTKIATAKDNIANGNKLVKMFSSYEKKLAEAEKKLGELTTKKEKLELELKTAEDKNKIKRKVVKDETVKR